jgi:membrane-associated protease RseP (regulator of RpoE activity)
MRPSSDRAAAALRFLLGWIVAGLPGAAGAQTSPPASASPSPAPAAAAAPGPHRLGVWIEPVSQWNGKSWVPWGLRIVGVSPGSPAERAGIQTGNVLTSVNGTNVSRVQDLLKALDNSGGRATLGLRDRRGDTMRQITSFAWTAAAAPSIPRVPTTSYAPYYNNYGATRGPGRVIHRPFYGNYGDAPSPNPFSTPPSYGDIVR